MDFSAVIQFQLQLGELGQAADYGKVVYLGIVHQVQTGQYGAGFQGADVGNLGIFNAEVGQIRHLPDEIDTFQLRGLNAQFFQVCQGHKRTVVVQRQVQ